MLKIKTPQELERLRDSIRAKREPSKKWIRICATGCKSQDVIDHLEREISESDLGSLVEIKKTGCHGFCQKGPLMVIEPDNIFYQKVKADDVSEILSETVLNGKVLDRLLYEDPETGERIIHEKDIPFYQRQMKIVTRNTGKIDPTDIEDYIASGGYSALVRAMTTMGRDEVIAAIEKSGLRGRGGAGFPAGVKWRACKEAPGDTKYIIGNGDEGDPGAFMDRCLMEGDPHGILEGMLIAAFAIYARQGYIYVRDEYPAAIDHLRLAIRQAGDLGLLGKDILGTGFDFTISLERGAGAFVCGEETALIASIEGKTGEPRARYLFPVVSGLWSRPTCINNVETLANVPAIINRGAEWYSEIGTRDSKGTKVFSLAGEVKHTGIVEVPMGAKLSEIVFDIGGGPAGNKKLKAIQTGGPLGGFILPGKLNTLIDYARMRRAGSMMGSGGVVVIGEDTCIVDLVRYFMGFLIFESCGKCLPCREGLKQAHEVLTNICQFRGEEGDIKLLKDLCGFMKDASLCALGKGAHGPVSSSIRFFKNEYMAHIVDKKCPAGVCREN